MAAATSLATPTASPGTSAWCRGQRGQLSAVKQHGRSLRAHPQVPPLPRELDTRCTHLPRAAAPLTRPLQRGPPAQGSGLSLPRDYIIQTREAPSGNQGQQHPSCKSPALRTPRQCSLMDVRSMAVLFVAAPTFTKVLSSFSQKPRRNQRSNDCRSSSTAHSWQGNRPSSSLPSKNC